MSKTPVRTVACSLNPLKKSCFFLLRLREQAIFQKSWILVYGNKLYTCIRCYILILFLNMYFNIFLCLLWKTVFFANAIGMLSWTRSAGAKVSWVDVARIRNMLNHPQTRFLQRGKGAKSKLSRFGVCPSPIKLFHAKSSNL